MSTIEIVSGVVPVYPEPLLRVLGPFFFGPVFTSMLAGAAIAQGLLFALYHRTLEPVTDRYLVIIGSLIGLATVVADICWGYAVFVDGFGKFDPLFGSPGLPTYTSYFTTLLLTVMLAATCQSYYALRCWRLWRRNALAGAFLAVAQVIAFGIGIAKVGWGISIRNNPTDHDLDIFASLAQGHFLGTALYDVIVVVGVCIPVLRLKNGFNASTDTVLHRIAFTVFGAATLTCIFTAALAVLSFTSGRTFSILFALCPVSHMLYLNSMLFSVNARDWLKDGASSYTPATRSPYASRSRSKGSSSNSSASQRDHLTFTPDLKAMPVLDDGKINTTYQLDIIDEAQSLPSTVSNR